MPVRSPAFLALAALVLMPPVAQAAAPEWVASWAQSPTPPLLKPASFWPTAPLTPSFQNQTVVQVVRLSAGGRRLRIRLSNEYGAAPLAIGAVRVALVGPDGKVTAERAVLFSGAASAVAPAHAPVVSDPVDIAPGPLATVRVSLYLPGDTGPCTCHYFGLDTVQVSPHGDFTSQPMPPDASTTSLRPFLSGVEVEREGKAPVIVAFGDSITDGAGSKSGANHRWPDLLAERLSGAGAAVTNEGIGGNMVLADGVMAPFGESALTRFDRDVLSTPGATDLFVLEGINDIGANPATTAEGLIAGYRQIIARAHSKGLKVIFATLVPYKGAFYFTDKGEAVRQAVNAWIRDSREPDGVVDFEAAVRDPADPLKMRADFQSGDWLHPNDAGYRAMADAVDLKLFR
jgi:lysophospholipase L1-like esterase